MKKRLEAELISIAHRILKLKNKSEVDQLYYEAQKLYEALSVLKFYGDNYEQFKSSIPYEDIEEKIAISLEDKKPIELSEIKEDVIETVAETTTVVDSVEESSELVEVNQSIETLEEADVSEEIPEIVDDLKVEVIEEKSDFDSVTLFELAAESPKDEILEVEDVEKQVAVEETKQISFEDLIGQSYEEPVFVKPNEITKPTSKKDQKEVKSDVVVEPIEEKTLSLNDKFSKVINIGLNDRMGFVKNLFGESAEDYNRVLSQLNSFTTFEEAKDFIDEIIKPDYNNWEGVEDYAERFIEIVEKKFL